jgi:hypothetical protein
LEERCGHALLCQSKVNNWKVGVGFSAVCGEALVRVYVGYRVKDGIGFRSVAIIDLVSYFCFIVDVEAFQCIIIVPSDVRCRMSTVVFMGPKEW